jgi:hypothetical protein
VAREGLETLTVPLPSGKGFPFELPAVDWIMKNYQAGRFFQEFDSTGTTALLPEKLQDDLRKLEAAIDACTGAETLATVRKLRDSAAEFSRLRQILGDQSATSKQIKQRIRLFKKHLKKRLPSHPHFNEILKRLDRYSDGLYHGYDDHRIPLTNLEIERYFNTEKRVYRRRTGLKGRKNQFVLEAEEILLGSHYRIEASKQDSAGDFIGRYREKRLLLTVTEITTLLEDSKSRKKQLREKYLKKHGFKKITAIYRRLKEKLSELSHSAS